jgi:hypothetical protein
MCGAGGPLCRRLGSSWPPADGRRRSASARACGRAAAMRLRLADGERGGLVERFEAGIKAGTSVCVHVARSGSVSVCLSVRGRGHLEAEGLAQVGGAHVRLPRAARRVGRGGVAGRAVAEEGKGMGVRTSGLRGLGLTGPGQPHADRRAVRRTCEPGSPTSSGSCRGRRGR